MAKRPATKTKAKSSSRAKAGSKKSSSSKKQLPSFNFDFSKEKLIEIGGIIFLVVGFISLVLTFFAKHGTFFAKWPDYLLKQTGIFSYVLPIILVLVGFWFLLSRYPQFPEVTIPRIFGATALIFNMVTWFQLFHAPNPVNAIALKGGGVIGKGIYGWFHGGLGTPGTVIMLIAWLLISLMFLVNLSLPALLAWMISSIKNARVRFSEFASNIAQIIRQRKAEREQFKEQPEQEALQSNLPLDDIRNELPQATKTRTTPPQTPPHPVTPHHESVSDGQRVWVLPEPENILNATKLNLSSDESDEERARIIEDTLRAFNAPGTVVEIRRGPVITLFGVEPDYIETRAGRNKVRVSKITALSNDLAMALKASRIRIQAPVPGKGYIGVEVPNRNTSLVSMLEIFQSTAFQSDTSALRFVLGKDVTGSPFTSDLSKMPHLLIAGTTGSGKSVCVNAILAGYLLTLTPDQLRLMLVDPKRVELTGYNGIPHLLAPVITEVDKVVTALQRMMQEMDLRYKVFAANGVRNIEEFNNKALSEGKKPLHYIIVVIDELADMMMLAPEETERTLIRLAQLARATGIHLIVATQRPSVNVVTGLIKSNFPARIAFSVASQTDSRVILDQQGAEKLLGRGDMLFQPPDAPEPYRLQGTFVSDEEINRLTDFWREQCIQPGAPDRPDVMTAGSSPHIPLMDNESWKIETPDPDADPIEAEVITLIRKEGRASISMLQRKFRIGYTRSARIIEKLEADGIIGPPSASGTRNVLDFGEFPPVNED